MYVVFIEYVVYAQMYYIYMQERERERVYADRAMVGVADGANLLVLAASHLARILFRCRLRSSRAKLASSAVLLLVVL